MAGQEQIAGWSDVHDRRRREFGARVSKPAITAFQCFGCEPRSLCEPPQARACLWSCFKLNFCSATIDFPNVSSFEADDLALAFHRSLASTLLWRFPSSPSGVALFDDPPNLPSQVLTKPFRSSVMRSRVQLEFLKNIGPRVRKSRQYTSSSGMRGWCHLEMFDVNIFLFVSTAWYT